MKEGQRRRLNGGHRDVTADHREGEKFREKHAYFLQCPLQSRPLKRNERGTKRSRRDSATFEHVLDVGAQGYQFIFSTLA
jgi:hypothetical protein